MAVQAARGVRDLCRRVKKEEVGMQCCGLGLGEDKNIRLKRLEGWLINIISIAADMPS